MEIPRSKVHKILLKVNNKKTNNTNKNGKKSEYLTKRRYVDNK